MPRRDNGMPTFQEMLDWRDQLGGEWGDLDDEQSEEEGTYFQEFEIESPGGRLGVKTGSAPADADAAIDSLVPPDISVKVRPARAREKYRKQADKLVRFGKGMLLAWRRKKDVIRMISGDMVIRRVAVFRVMLDDTVWHPTPAEYAGKGDMPVRDDYDEGEAGQSAYETALEDWDGGTGAETWEAHNRRKVPIILQRRNPRYTRWRETEEGELLVVVERYPTTVLEARAEFGHYAACQAALRGLEPNFPVMVDDIWQGEYRCLVLADKPLFPAGEGEYGGVVKHGYPEIPYVIAPFRELPFEEMQRRYRGMLTNAVSLYKIESNVLTMQVWMLAINAWRTYLGWTKDGRDIDIKPGQYIPIDERIGEYLKMLEGQPVPPELLQTSGIMDNYIQRNGVAQGPRSAEGTRSGQQLWAIQAMRQLKIESAKDALSRGLERSLYLAAMILEKMMQEPLTLPVPGKTKDGEDMGEVSVRPKDIDGYWEGFEVSLGRRLDPALLEQWKALSGLSAQMWMPHRTSIELSGATDNPQEWIDELVREAVDKLPFILEEVGLERIKNWFGEDSERFIALAQKLQSQQQQAGSPMDPKGVSGQPNLMGKPTNQAGGGGTGDMLTKSLAPRAGRPKGATGRPPRGAPPA